MKKWGVIIKDPKAEFESIDANKGGSLLFDEFSHYCITKSLDLEDDDEDEDYEEGEEGLKKDGRDPRIKQKYRHYNAGVSPLERQKQASFVKDVKFTDIRWDDLQKFFPVGKDDKDKKKRSA